MIGWLLYYQRVTVTIIFKMASSSKRANIRFTAEQIRQILINDDNNDESDIDSETGGLSSGEEYELDQNFEEESACESDERLVKV